MTTIAIIVVLAITFSCGVFTYLLGGNELGLKETFIVPVIGAAGMWLYFQLILGWNYIISRLIV